MSRLKIRNGFFAAVLCCLWAAMPLSGGAAQASTVEAPGALFIVNDGQSGLALFGYDPVAYHVDSKAMEGKAAFSYLHQQLEWRFVSAANRDAFIADPAAYIPAFGGHDGKAISEGHMTTGDPLHFFIASGELVFFRSAETRDLFRADPGIRRTAVSRWPEVLRQHGFH